MNREMILAMEPGREMDELVMTTLFGARRATYGDEERWYHYDENGETDYEWNFYNSPSTDIAAAWQVVEKLKDIFHICTYIADSEDDGFEPGWIVKFGKHGVVGLDSVEEAICKAALLSTLEESI